MPSGFRAQRPEPDSTASATARTIVHRRAGWSIRCRLRVADVSRPYRNGFKFFAPNADALNERWGDHKSGCGALRRCRIWRKLHSVNGRGAIQLNRPAREYAAIYARLMRLGRLGLTNRRANLRWEFSRRGRLLVRIAGSPGNRFRFRGRSPLLHFCEDDGLVDAMQVFPTVMSAPVLADDRSRRNDPGSIRNNR